MMVVGLFNFYAGEVFRLYGRELVRPAGLRSTVRHEPVGPVAAFAPWNFPLGNPGRKLGAPIAAGCSVILKSAEETPGFGARRCSRRCSTPGCPRKSRRRCSACPTKCQPPPARLADHPQAQLHRLHRGRQAPAKLAADNMQAHHDGTRRPRPGAGVRRRRRRPGARHRGRPASTATPARSASRPTRFIVQEDVFERFRDGFAERAAEVKVGDGLDEGTQMGPMANPRRPEAMERLIGDARRHGRDAHTGGERIGNQGFFYAADRAQSEVPLERRHHERGAVRPGRADQPLQGRGRR